MAAAAILMISKNVNISRVDTQLLVIISYTDFDHITSHHIIEVIVPNHTH